MVTSAQAVSAEKTAPCLARLPILTKDEKVVGYEVLFRKISDNPQSAADNIFDALSDIGLDIVCDGSLAFISCTQEMLVQDAFLDLPLDKVVIEINRDVTVSSPVIEACERLKQKGYKIAIDNFCHGDEREPLLPFASLLKLDWSSENHVELAAAHARKPYKLLAQTWTHDLNAPLQKSPALLYFKETFSAIQNK